MKISILKKPLGILSLAVLLGVAVFLIIAATKNNSSRRCKGLSIKIKDADKQLLVNKTDIESWITDKGNDPVDGKIIEKIDLTELEKRALQSGYVKKCQVFVDLQGILNIDVEVFSPIARILPFADEPHRYIDSEGNIFPFSNRHSATVLLISGEYLKNIKSLKSPSGNELVKLLNTIYNDPFWNAQITQINIDRHREITMTPLLGNHIIEFGKPEKINSKLKKLMVFYTNILPRDEWSNFSKVSVKYAGQIVCN